MTEKMEKINLSDLRDSRYSRLERIPWWNQSILINAKVLVIGCGALGNEIVKNLAMLGIGEIYAADLDLVEKSNLTRSILFRTEDEGSPKAEVIAKRAKEINEEVNIKYFHGNVFELGTGVFRKMDIVICGLDNRGARLFVNESCWKVNKAWVDGAIEMLSGTARVFIPPGGACYECTMNETDYALINKRKSCLLLGIDEIESGKVPTTPTVSSIIAGVQVQEAVKYLHGGGLNILSGKGFVFNGLTNDSYTVEYQKKDDCASHHTLEKIIQSNINFANAKLSDVIDAGRKEFGDGFTIDFNGELVYALEDSKGNETEFFANMNLLKTNDIKRGEELMKCKTFHSVSCNDDKIRKFGGMKLKDMKIPANDILIIRKGDKEAGVEFGYAEIFREAPR